MLCLCRLNLQYKHFSTHKKSETLTLRMKNSPPSFISMETGYLLYCSCKAFSVWPWTFREATLQTAEHCRECWKKVEPSQISLGKLKRFTFYLKIGTLHTSHFVTTQMSQMVNRFTHKKGTFVQDITCNFRSLKDSFSDLTNHLEKNPPSQVAPVMHHRVMNSVDSHCANWATGLRCTHFSVPFSKEKKGSVTHDSSTK